MDDKLEWCFEQNAMIVDKPTIDLTKILSVGDIVFSTQYGYGVVEQCDSHSDSEYPITVQHAILIFDERRIVTLRYTKDGKYLRNDMAVSISIANCSPWG